MTKKILIIIAVLIMLAAAAWFFAISFLVEKNNYYKAVSNLLQAKYDYIFKNKILDFYMGNPITF